MARTPWGFYSGMSSLKVNYNWRSLYVKLLVLTFQLWELSLTSLWNVIPPLWNGAQEDGGLLRKQSGIIQMLSVYRRWTTSSSWVGLWGLLAMKEGMPAQNKLSHSESMSDPWSNSTILGKTQEPCTEIRKTKDWDQFHKLYVIVLKSILRSKFFWENC